jgi:hypothetical protein
LRVVRFRNTVTHWEAAKIGDPIALPALRAALADHEITQVNAPTSSPPKRARQSTRSINDGHSIAQSIRYQEV